VRIRDARPEELESVGELRVAAYLAAGFLSPDSAYAARLRALGAHGDGEVLVAVREDPEGSSRDEIVGTVMIRRWPGGQLMRAPDEAEVRALAVAPDSRGRGIGRKLVSAVVERARVSGLRHLVLASQPDMARTQGRRPWSRREQPVFTPGSQFQLSEARAVSPFCTAVRLA
jgi:ribosomal protein S18 acetylase RimI-like enzyme